MKEFIGSLQKIKEQYEGRKNAAPTPAILVNIFSESFFISHALQNHAFCEQHFFLAILKLAPESLAVRYLETIQSRADWRKQWQGQLMKNAKPAQETIHLQKDFGVKFQKLMRTIGLERELLGIQNPDENCIFLALLRYQDFDGMIYKDALQFIKKNLQNP